MRKRLELVDLSLVIATVHIWIVLKNVIVDGLHIVGAVTSVAMVFLVSYLILDAIRKSVIIRKEKGEKKWAIMIINQRLSSKMEMPLQSWGRFQKLSRELEEAMRSKSI